MPNCVAIKANGEVCGKRCVGANTRCGIHIKTLENNGPNLTATNELEYTQKAAVRNLITNNEQIIQQEQNPALRVELRATLRQQEEVLRLRNKHDMENLIAAQRAEIRRTGIDPDEEARQRRFERQQERDRLWRENNQIVFGDHADGRAFHVIPVVARAVAPAVAPVVDNELRQFANDAQNVHTTSAVKQTKDIVERLLKIPVPNEYKWNSQVCSKTPGEISMMCKLTPKAAWQMFSKYCQDESIYDLGIGIYGKVLDGVWQYILNSPAKEDICKSVKQEMEDNIGMCAQGNLSRLCNILAGYLEGIGNQESVAEMLGRRLSNLMKIENQDERLDEAFKVFMELGIPKEEWLSWAEPLVESGNVTIHTDITGVPIGLIAH